MIIVTGGEGQLSTCIRDVIGDDALYPSRSELDITNLHSIKSYLEDKKTTVLINCAAFTKVDLCETEKDSAFLVNKDGPSLLAQVCLEKSIKLIHISTDYVFSGESFIPYLENDPCNPNSVYGHSKREGEKEVLKYNKDAIIIRTSWLYSEYGNNFVTNMTKHLTNRDELNVVYDQIGSPTYAVDLAEFISHIIKNNIETQGIIHYSNTGVASWYDLTTHIKNSLKLNCKISPILTHEYPLPAKRPPYSVFNTMRARSIRPIPYWTESLENCLGKITAKQ